MATNVKKDHKITQEKGDCVISSDRLKAIRSKTRNIPERLRICMRIKSHHAKNGNKYDNVYWNCKQREDKEMILE
jgi:hypothetical protein